MPAPDRAAYLLLESATTLAHACSARAILVAADALPDIEAVPPRTVLVKRSVQDDPIIERLAETALGVIEVPEVELDRMGQVKLAGIVGLAQRILELQDTAIFLTGPYRSRIDTLVVMTLGAEYELFDTASQPNIDEHIKRAVFHRVLTLALTLGQHGREGRRSGALIVVGDYRRVRDQAEQMILNPFKGYEESVRNILDDRVTETVKEFSVLDGAFLVRGNGTIETAGARLKVGSNADLPSGLGSRHAAAAGITGCTKSIAFTVSETDGVVRVWRAGKMLASFEPA